MRGSGSAAPTLLFLAALSCVFPASIAAFIGPVTLGAGQGLRLSQQLQHFPRPRTTGIRGIAIESIKGLAGTSMSFVKHEILDNKLGVITLDRPKALNAADLAINKEILGKVAEWEGDGSARALLLTSSSERAFCSGGDVKALALALREDASSTLPALALAEEYKLICKLADSTIPSVAIMDGVTMGFGLGLATRATFRIATERTLVAMPECAIGLFPDVGFSHAVAHKPAEGMYMALTGARIGASSSPPDDILSLSLATHFVPSASLPSLVTDLSSLPLSSEPETQIREAIAKHTTSPPGGEGGLKERGALIRRCFGEGLQGVEGVVEELEAVKGEADEASSKWAAESLAVIGSACPMSLCASFAHIRRVSAKKLTLVDVMRDEYRMARRLAYFHDFSEGVRAQLIDKTKDPKWNPASLSDVSQATIAALFDPVSDELEVDAASAKRARTE